MMRRSLFATVTVTGMMGSLAGGAHATEIVAPNALATTEGSLSNGFPFNLSFFRTNSQRYQQVYAASQFTALGGPQLVTSIYFRPDASVGGAFSTTLPDVRIDLSTTLAAPDALSSNFASNVGADNTAVYSGALSLSSAFTGPAGGPKDFDIVIRLMTPFLYDPAAGNLLLDVRNFGGGTTTFFDAVNAIRDPISRVHSFPNPNGVDDASGTTDGAGLVTKFEFQTAVAVPEPSTLAGAGVGLFLAGVAVIGSRLKVA